MLVSQRAASIPLPKDWPGRAANSTIFVEIPDIRPAMQAHLFGKLKAADGTEFSLNLLPTLLWLRDDWKGFDGYTASDPDKPTDLELRVRWPIPFTPKHPQGRPGRKIAMTMVTGLQFEQKEIRAKAGERITIDFATLGGDAGYIGAAGIARVEHMRTQQV